MNSPEHNANFPYAEFDEQYSKSRHYTFAHFRSSMATVGGLLIVDGIGLAAAGMKIAIPAIGCISVGFFGLVGLLIRELIPCKCGRPIVLSAKRRLRAKFPAHAKRLSYVILAALVLASFSSLPILIALKHLFGHDAPNEAIAGFAIVAGMACLALAFLDILPPSELRDSEVNELRTLQGRSVEELTRLVTLHLKAGHFDKADECSRKLISLSEGAQIP